MAQATLADLPIGSVVSFDTYAPAVLGTNYKNCTIMSHLDARDAQALGSDVLARHTNIYPSLPSGTPNDPYSYFFVKVKLLNGNYDYLGVCWVRKETITSRQVNRGIFTVEDIGADDVQRITDILSAADYSKVTVTLE